MKIKLKNLPDVFYKDCIFSNNVSLKDLTNLDIKMFGDGQTIRFYREFDFFKTKAISFDIPYYEQNHPEKYIGSKFNMFTILEYTKEEAYITEHIDLNSFKNKFNTALKNICNLKTLNNG